MQALPGINAITNACALLVYLRTEMWKTVWFILMRNISMQVWHVIYFVKVMSVMIHLLSTLTHMCSRALLLTISGCSQALSVSYTAVHTQGKGDVYEGKKWGRGKMSVRGWGTRGRKERSWNGDMRLEGNDMQPLAERENGRRERANFNQNSAHQLKRGGI